MARPSVRFDAEELVKFPISNCQYIFVPSSLEGWRKENDPRISIAFLISSIRYRRCISALGAKRGDLSTC